ncbi:hypothetical protein BH11ACT8_BH11ACT8_30990 [soil metagenome]
MHSSPHRRVKHAFEAQPDEARVAVVVLTHAGSGGTRFVVLAFPAQQGALAEVLGLWAPSATETPRPSG